MSNMKCEVKPSSKHRFLWLYLLTAGGASVSHLCRDSPQNFPTPFKRAAGCHNLAVNYQQKLSLPVTQKAMLHLPY